MKVSFYNHLTRLNDNEFIVFNKFYGSISVLSQNVATILRSGDTSKLEPKDLQICLENGFILDENLDEFLLGKQRFEENKFENDVLDIIFELTRNCNFSCPYCYQNNSKSGRHNLSKQLVNQVVSYVNNVLHISQREIKTLHVSFIGGEPLLRMKNIELIIQEAKKITDFYQIELKTKIDTNGYFLNKDIVKNFDLISITLTNQMDHDVMRPLHNGDGTFETILSNLATIKDDLNSSGKNLNIRYNTNHNNFKYIEEVYNHIEQIGIERFTFSLAYTIDYDYNQIVNHLSQREFKEIYLNFLNFLACKGKFIEDFPLPTFSVCKAYIPYNLKVYGNGKLGLCDAFINPISHISEVHTNPSEYFNTFKSYTNYNPYDNKRCTTCPDIGICGGEYFCKINEHTKDISSCNFLPYDLDDYLRFFVTQYPNSPELFLALINSGDKNQC